jgi:thioredoxin reductase
MGGRFDVVVVGAGNAAFSAAYTDRERVSPTDGDHRANLQVHDRQTAAPD